MIIAIVLATAVTADTGLRTLLEMVAEGRLDAWEMPAASLSRARGGVGWFSLSEG